MCKNRQDSSFDQHLYMEIEFIKFCRGLQNSAMPKWNGEQQAQLCKKQLISV